jgi:AraC-like DNA-binding protein
VHWELGGVSRAAPAGSPRTLLLLDSPALRPFTFMGGEYRAQVLDWAALIPAARCALPSAAVLVDGFTSREPEPDPRLKDLLKAAPSLPVLVGFDLATARAPGVRLLADLGVSDFVDLPIEHNPSSLLVRLQSTHARPFKRRIEKGLPDLSLHALTLVTRAAGVAADRGLSTDLAQEFSVGERTLTGWCTREGLPPPRRLLAWLRVLLGIALLEEPWRTMQDTARAVGYTDDSTFRRAAAALLGQRLRRGDPPFDAALAAFGADLKKACPPHGPHRPAPRGTGCT